MAKTQGDFFQAKLLETARLQHKTSEYDVYVYQIIIAPASTKEKRFSNIYFSPDASVLSYINDAKFGMTSLSLLSNHERYQGCNCISIWYLYGCHKIGNHDTGKNETYHDKYSLSGSSKRNASTWFWSACF